MIQHIKIDEHKTVCKKNEGKKKKTTGSSQLMEKNHVTKSNTLS